MSNSGKRICGIAILIAFIACASTSIAQNVSVQVSAREAWVDSPVVLQIRIDNATDYSLPESFEIDGCDVQTNGTPSVSSQITIINGRRSESRSVTMQYLITPRRKGTFEIPQLEFEVGGVPTKSQPISFVATLSETGDLMFVEIEGDRDSVYVGQPLGVKLKIWIKPYRDEENNLEFEENHMWQLLSDQTSWGDFSERLEQLAHVRQRPRGRKAKRVDEDGLEQDYILYEIETTVYPTRPGSIDTSGVQIVMNYPLEIGQSRDVFDTLFDETFGAMRRMTAEDVFGASPFGRRLSVTKSRPISAGTSVSSTKVLRVPEAGKPADYRGAVGNYQIVSEADSQTVDAGDPITLKIGVVGDGPMDLIQAPPLHEIESLTKDFKVADQSLPGYSRQNTKIFVTTIRPRNADVSEIPAIPFSFFDPESESFKTVYSAAVPIKVNEAEMLSMNSIVSNSGPTTNPSNRSDKDSSAKLTAQTGPDLQNDFSPAVLSTQSTAPLNWWYFAIIPPAIWLMVLTGRFCLSASAAMPSLRSARSIALSRIDKSKSSDDVIGALTEFVNVRTKQSTNSPTAAIGALRNMHLTEIANEVESVFNRISRKESQSFTQTRSATKTDDIKGLVERLDSEITEATYRDIRKTRSTNRTRNPRSSQTTISSILFLLLICFPAHGQQSDPAFTASQIQGLFEEANHAYRLGEQCVSTDQAEANDLFATSAAKYQLLVDQGIVNADLFANLGNAQLRTGKTANAIASYHRALRIEPGNARAATNLRFAKEQIQNENSNTAQNGDDDTPSAVMPISRTTKQSLATFFHWLNELFGVRFFGVVFAVASVVFWALVILRTVGVKAPLVRLAIAPLCIGLISLCCLLAADHQDSSLAVLLRDKVDLRAGDGKEFEIIETISPAAGVETRVLDRRNNWLKLSVEGRSHSGWAPESSVELIEFNNER